MRIQSMHDRVALLEDSNNESHNHLSSHRSAERTKPVIPSLSNIKALNEADLTYLSSLPATDTGNGDRFVHQFKDRFRYLSEGRWLHFDGTCWTTRNARDIAFEAAKTVAQRIAQERNLASGESFDRKQWSKQSQSRARLEHMIECARTQLLADSHDFDRDKFALNVANGTIRFEREAGGTYSLRLTQHAAEDLMMRKAMTGYDASAKAPAWRRHLERVQPDPEVRAYLQRVFGYCMLGTTREHAVFIFQGNGGDGKTTTVNAVSRVLHDYASTIDVLKLLESRVIQNAEAAAPMLASIAGDIRLVCASEPPSHGRLDEALVKRLTGGEKLKVRRPYQDTFEFTPCFKIVLECNVLPRIVGADEGIWRRIRVVPWNAQIPRAQMDVSIDEKLAAEAPGILNWLLEGALSYLERGLQEPLAVRRAIAKYRANSQTVMTWADECTRELSDAKVAQCELWNSYQGFCSQRRLRAVRRGAFVSQLDALGFQREPKLHTRTRQVMWAGRLLVATL